MASHVWLRKPTEMQAGRLSGLYRLARKEKLDPCLSACMAGYFAELCGQKSVVFGRGRRVRQYIHSAGRACIDGARIGGFRFAKGKNVNGYLRAFLNHWQSRFENEHPTFRAEWLSPTVSGVAARLLGEVDPAKFSDGLPILADALEEAGCPTGSWTLAHLRDREWYNDGEKGKHIPYCGCIIVHEIDMFRRGVGGGFGGWARKPVPERESVTYERMEYGRVVEPGQPPPVESADSPTQRDWYYESAEPERDLS